MAKIQATIKDENTLELLQDGKAGDTIDLRSLQEADFNSVSDTVRKTINREVELGLEKERARITAENESKLEAALLRSGKEAEKKHQEEL